MRNLDRLFILPLLAAFSVGCSSPTALQTSEYDDVYYSSKDKTVFKEEVPAAAPANTAPVPQAENRVATAPQPDNSIPNPEYSERSSTSNRTYASNNTEDYYSDDYYDTDNYYYASQIRRFHTPYRGFSYYDYAYTNSFWYNRNPHAFSRIYVDPFYAYNDFLCYPPYGWGYPHYGNSLTVIIGRPYAGFYGPYYGGGFGSRYGGGFYGDQFYNGYRNGFYNGYHANNVLYRNDNNSARNVQYGPRRDRSSVPSGGGTVNSGSGSRPRREMGGSIGGGGGVARPDEGNTRGARDGSNAGNVSENAGRTSSPDISRSGGTRVPVRSSRRGDENANPVTGDNQGAITNPVPRETERSGRPSRVEPRNYEFPSEPTRTEESRPSSRPRMERGSSDHNTPREPQRRVEEAPARAPQRPTYEAPRQQERPRYEAPREQERPVRQEPTYQAPTRTYEQPTRSAPAPSSGGSSNDGGSSGGRGGRPRN